MQTEQRPRRLYARGVLLLITAAGIGSGFVRRRRTGSPAPADGPAAPEPLAVPPPGSPRLLSVVGGTVRHGAAQEPTVTPLHTGRLVVGRSRDAGLHLADLTVSPHHAELDVDEQGHVLLRDLGATNGVNVDGVPVAIAQLRDGNRLDLGDVSLVFRSDPVTDDGGRQGGELGEQPEAGRWQSE